MKSRRIACAVLSLALLSACGSSSSGGGAPVDAVSSPKDTAADVPAVPQDVAGADTAKADAAAPQDASPDAAALEPLDDFIDSRLDVLGTPGLAFCLVKAGKVALCKGYGFMDLEAGTPVTAASIFAVGGLSQLVTAAAVMQQVEAGKLDLDADIGTYLGYPLRNPAFPDVALTLRMLLAYTSSLQDPDSLDASNDGLIAALYPAGDPTETLAQVTDAVFKTGGKWYDAKKLFSADKPGTTFGASSFGLALAGYLVEKVAGQSFEAYTKAKIFTPLAMTKTTWHLAGIDMTQLALPYTINEDGEYAGYELTGSAVAPADGLHTSAAEFARFLLAFILDGSLDGVKILEKTSVAEMRKIQYPKAEDTQGLVWYTAPITSDAWLGSSGIDWGYTADAYYRVKDGLGFVVFANGEWDDATVQEIEERLIQEADKL